MVCAPVRSIIPSLKLGDYLSVQAHKLCSISHMEQCSFTSKTGMVNHVGPDQGHATRISLIYFCTVCSDQSVPTLYLLF